MGGHRAWPEESFLNSLPQPTALAIAVTLLAVLLTTRFITGGSSPLPNGKTPPLAPYWAPCLGHAPRAVLSIHSLLSGFRSRYNEGTFSIRLLGTIHSFVFRPSLSQDLLGRPSSEADEQWIVRHLLLTNFGLRKRDLPAYDAVAPHIQDLNKRLLSGAALDEITKTTMNQLKSQVSDWVTFNTYPVDQMDWERLADADLIEDNGKGEKVMEANLLELTRNFVARTANAAIFGTDFIENFPDAWQLLWTLDEDFVPLVMDIPIWVPSRSTQRGRNAMRKLLSYLVEYHDALDKEMNDEDVEPKWEDLNNVSQLVKSRVEMFRKHNLPLDARAALDLSLLWSLNANSTHLVFWMLFELYQDPVLLSQARDEIAPFAKVVQPDNEFGLAVWVPPRVETLDVDGLVEKCPLLKAAYTESVRLYGGGWSARRLQEDVTIGGGSEPIVLKKGTFAHVVQDLWHSDPNCFSDPKEWQPGRHIEEIGDAKGATKLGFKTTSIKTYDGGLTKCDDSALAMRKVLAYSAVLISFYDVEPAKGGRWNAPTIVHSAVSKIPFWSGKVWVKRREFPRAKQTVLV